MSKVSASALFLGSSKPSRNCLYQGVDSYVLNKLNFQIIGLLDCFTPQSTLDQFADVYMVRFVGRKQL